MSEHYIYKKEVDWSLLHDGISIPCSNQVVFGQIMGRFLKRGESKDITLYFCGNSYKAKIYNLGIDERHKHKSDIVQIRYRPHSEIARMLRLCFSKSYQYLSAAREARQEGDHSLIKVPEDIREYLAIYTTEYDDTYLMEPIVAEETSSLMEIMAGRPERIAEAEFNYDVTDSTSTVYESERIVKIRKLNKKIGDNLKLLYGYRCQICGQIIGEEYGSHVVEAHHIDYFVKSLNNDANNQLIVCPNHHAIIHDADPVFDRKRLLYLYKNGEVQKILLNKHLG